MTKYLGTMAEMAINQNLLEYIYYYNKIPDLVVISPEMFTDLQKFYKVPPTRKQLEICGITIISDPDFGIDPNKPAMDIGFRN